MKSGLRICIAANFTIDPIAEVLAYWMSELRIPSEICIAPYNQVFQQLLEGGMLRANHAGINLIALDLDSWLPDGENLPTQRDFDQIVSEFTAAIKSAALAGTRGAVLLFPPSVNINDGGGALLSAARNRICDECASTRAWTVIELARTAELYGVREVRDPFTRTLADIPFTEEMYAAAATATARWIRAGHSRPRKVVAIDCDNTIWHGICGEGDIKVTPAHSVLQDLLLRQQDKGMLLAIVSKNNEADVMTALASEQCLLHPEHLTAWRINWQPKSTNLRELSEELGLALNSFVFLDDSPFECSEVRQQLPDVLTIQVPADPETMPDFLDHLWIFDHDALTEEDRNRVNLYQGERKRTELSRSLTPEEFLATLRIEIDIAPVKAVELARVVQLSERTTQFNLTGVKYTEQSLAETLKDERNVCWIARVRDKFGDYGLVGALIFRNDPDCTVVDSFLLSCRALGRGVEDRMLAELKGHAVARGAKAIKIPFIPTVRNRPALEFLHRQCSVPLDVAEALECVLSPSAGSVAWRPFTASPALTAVSSDTKSPPITAGEDQVLLRIATEMRTAGDILSAIRSSLTERVPADVPFAPPRTKTERIVARVWSDVLRVHPIGIHDEFHQLGGSSLLAVQVLARIRSGFGVELSLTDFLRRPTVEGVAGCLEIFPAERTSTRCAEVISASSA